MQKKKNDIYIHVLGTRISAGLRARARERDTLLLIRTRVKDFSGLLDVESLSCDAEGKLKFNARFSFLRQGSDLWALLLSRCD